MQRGRMWIGLVCVGLAACGRCGFDDVPLPDGGGFDGATADAGFDAGADGGVDGGRDGGTGTDGGPTCVETPVTPFTPMSGAEWTNLVWTGAGAAIVFQTAGSNIRLVFIARDGALIGGAHDLESSGTTAERPNIARAGDGFVVTWDEDSGGRHHVIAAEVAADGSLVDMPVDVSRSMAQAWRADLVVDAGLAWIVWKDEASGNLELTASSFALGTHALVMPFALTDSTTSSQQPSLVLGATGIAVAYQENGTADEVWVTTLEAPRAPARVSVEGEIALAPEIAWNGRSYLVVYQGGSPARTVAVPLDAGLVAGEPIMLSDMGAGAVGEPAVATAGDDFAVAWTASDQVFAVRVGADGLPLGAVVARAAMGAKKVEAAWTGDGLAVSFDTTSGMAFAVLCL